MQLCYYKSNDNKLEQYSIAISTLLFSIAVSGLISELYLMIPNHKINLITREIIDLDNNNIYSLILETPSDYYPNGFHFATIEQQYEYTRIC